MKGRLSKLRDILREQGFKTYADEEKGDFTFIEERALPGFIFRDNSLSH
jgi:hypothetical protein